MGERPNAKAICYCPPFSHACQVSWCGSPALVFGDKRSGLAGQRCDHWGNLFPDKTSHHIFPNIHEDIPDHLDKQMKQRSGMADTKYYRDQVWLAKEAIRGATFFQMKQATTSFPIYMKIFLITLINWWNRDPVWLIQCIIEISFGWPKRSSEEQLSSRWNKQPYLSQYTWRYSWSTW